MIFVSSSCAKAKKIKDAVETLAKQGFDHIELSGGTEYYPDFDRDLIEMKKKYRLNFICHNYFPPPKNPFVLNLASLDNSIYKRSINFLEDSLSLSATLGATRFGVHAGYYCDPQVDELGNPFQPRKVAQKDEALSRFCEAIDHLTKKARKQGITLYVENNVLSQENYQTYGREKPFLLVDLDDFLQLQKQLSFNLLFDIAHYKVSANTLGENFVTGLKTMGGQSQYWHISDNDGLNDQNLEMAKDSELLKTISALEDTPLIITLETTGDINCIRNSFETIKKATS